MSRVINPNSPGKLRNQLLKTAGAAAQVILTSSPDLDERKDLAAYLLKNLEGINATVSQTVDAWEKRDYWVKADNFRYEWRWTAAELSRLEQLILSENLELLDEVARAIDENTRKLKIPKKYANQKPWMGAWDTLDLELSSE